ncbi:hypothetical protein [Thermus albus]|uniref:hypothetical protein n=1 Tax=Thermus albus TaxID=2908146 RepID=UPI001FA96259|nr:hypothetical protein [Thermus albus]
MVVKNRDQEKLYRQDLAFAGAGLLLKGRVREAFSFFLASQALYSRQLLEVVEEVRRGNLEEAVWLSFGYTHHPTLEKRPVYGPPREGWKPVWEIMKREAQDNPHLSYDSTLLSRFAYTVHLGELTAFLVVDVRKGFPTALEVAEKILEHRPLMAKYGLLQVSGALPGHG